LNSPLGLFVQKKSINSKIVHGVVLYVDVIHNISSGCLKE